VNLSRITKEFYMASKKQNRIKTSLEQLALAIKAYESSDKDDRLPFLALSKAFEVAIEYAWRELKIRVEDEGLEAPSPKAAIKQAAKLKLIDDAEKWLACINARNDSVHDYFGIPESDYVRTAKDFIGLASKILR